MEVQVAESGPCRRSLTIKIPAETIREHVSGAYQEASTQVKIKGFRSGKVPRKVLEQKYGPSILEEAKESLINKFFQEACRQQEIQYLGQPQVQGTETPLDQDSEYQFEVLVDVRPEVSIQRTKGIEVKHENTDVTEEDLESGLAQLAEQKRSLKSVDEPVEDGDFVKADLTFKKDGEVVDSREGSQLNTNIPVAGTDHEVFKNKLLGAEKGKQIEVDLKFPDTFAREDLRGEDGQVEILVHEVMRVVSPPIDEEFAKGFDFEDLDALKQELRKRIGEEKDQGDKNRIEQTIVETLLQENPFEVPQSMIEDQKQFLMNQAAQQLKERGMDEAAIKAELAKHDEAAQEEANQKVRAFFVLDKIARDEKIFVTEGEVDVEFRNIAAANKVSYEAAKKHFEENDQVGNLRLEIMERKVRDFLRENAKITDM
ncbi:MAG: trigger factor [Planctomycetota bacterium]|nr:trigger factor [Planctomycetota bacterium]